jgi:hypothetical protein
MVLSIEHRKAINKIRRITMKDTWKFQGFVTFPNLGLDFSELNTRVNRLIARYNRDFRR